jgi:RimJ/RimL family protein N-acetyltransferase
MHDGATATHDRLPDLIKTPRLTLRRWRHDQAAIVDAVVRANLDHLRPWMPWIKFEPLTRAERVSLIEQWTRDWEDGGDVVMGVFLDGAAIGGTGLHRRVGPGAIEIGYWIDGAHTRQGYATEITAALTTAALDLDDIDTVHVHVDEVNEASAGVPAKLGFTRQRVDEREPGAPGESGRLGIWTIDADTWERRVDR